MDNQHKLIKGYRDLSAKEIALMNEIKTKGDELRELCVKAEQHIQAQYAACDPWKTDSPSLEQTHEQAAEDDRLSSAEPLRWLGSARESLQVGIMELVRSIAQPTGF